MLPAFRAVALPALLYILLLAIGQGLPLHIPVVILTASAERVYMVDHITRTSAAPLAIGWAGVHSHELCPSGL